MKTVEGDAASKLLADALQRAKEAEAKVGARTHAIIPL